MEDGQMPNKLPC